MGIALFDYDSKYHNLALMKLSAWHKRKGDEVEFYKPLWHSIYDKIYCSKIFTKANKNGNYRTGDMICGGSGIDIKRKLPKEIEHIRPDYSLYNLNYSLGFTTRGCIRSCGFCIVRQKEGYIKEHAEVEEFLNPKSKVIVLLDNNFLALSSHIKKLQKYIDKDWIMDFNQGLDCYDNKTELLTKTGWKLFKNVNYEDKIATLNSGTHELEYQELIYIIEKDYSGELIGIDNNGISLLVTPQHNLYINYHYDSGKAHLRYKEKHPDCKRYNWAMKDLEFHLESAKNILNRTNINFKKDAIWKGKEEEFFELPGTEKRYGLKTIENKIIRMDDWIEFLGWYLSEGHTYKLGNGPYGGGAYYVKIDQYKNKKYREEIYNCCSRMGFKPTIKKRGISIYNKQLHTYLKKFGKAHDKFVPQFIKEMSRRQILIFLNSYSKGDGNGEIKEGKYLNIASSSKRIIDDLQELILKHGWSGNIKLKMKKGTKFESYWQRGKFYKCGENLYYLTVRKHFKGTRIYNFKNRNEISIKHYKGKVYCVTVPNGIIYVRREGKAVWCGNCRLINEENARLLAKVKHLKQIHFAWDLMSYEKEFKEGMNILSKAGIKPYRIMVFVLCGFNTTFEEDLYRFNELLNLGVDPFIMIYGNVDRRTKEFARWVNKRLYKFCELEDFIRWRGGKCTYL